MSKKPHRPDIHVAPPLVFGGGFLIGYLVDRLLIPVSWPSHSGAGRSHMIAGLVFIGLGVALALWGVAVFRRAKTTIMPFRASTAVVQDGPYRFTRNPMYVGMTLVYLGASLVFNTTWPVILLPLVLWTMVRLVISREEAFLSTTFGSAYDNYRARVRRWL